jgi:cell division protein FtsL
MNLRAYLERIEIDIPLLAMIVLTIVSAVAVIYIKHVSRSEFIQLQKLEKSRDALNEEWGRLLLEESTLGNPSRVERQASSRLQMVVPADDKTVVIER